MALTFRKLHLRFVAEVGPVDLREVHDPETLAGIRAGPVLDWCRAQKISRLILWSDTRFDLAHRLYTRTGFRRTGERSLPGDVNNSREYRFEREV